MRSDGRSGKNTNYFVQCLVCWLLEEYQVLILIPGSSPSFVISLCSKKVKYKTKNMILKLNLGINIIIQMFKYYCYSDINLGKINKDRQGWLSTGEFTNRIKA